MTTDNSERDLFIYSGEINSTGADRFADMVRHKDDPSAKTSLLLTTRGGDAHAAFRIARALSQYESIRLLIAGQYKSAGTLIALAAHEIAFGPWGELGPLDVQLRKPDEIFQGHSGLDALQALSIVTDHGYGAFQQYVLDLTARAGLSTRSAMEIAAKLVAGLFEPIAGQIDPHRLGEAKRAIQIANDYGRRLSTRNVKPTTLDLLISGYSTHNFVLDRAEAEDLFKYVGVLTDNELSAIEQVLANYGSLRYPAEGEPVILDGTGVLEGADGNSSARSPEAPDGAESGDSGATGASAGDQSRTLAPDSTPSDETRSRSQSA